MRTKRVLSLALSLAFASAPCVPVQAQRLMVEVMPLQPTAMQEFEVAYTADCEIQSVEMPRWGALRLVRELGHSQGTVTTIQNGETSKRTYHAYRYRVRCAVSGEVSVPGTAAVVGGRACRFEPTRITVLPVVAAVRPVCLLVRDPEAEARYGGCVVRLSCNRKPDSVDPVLLVDGKPCTPSSRNYSLENGVECYDYFYRIDLPAARSCRLVPQLSFGGEPYPMQPLAIASGRPSAVGRRK